MYLAAKKQQSGASMDEVADYVRETIPHLCHWFTVNDLMFLKRGGRVVGVHDGLDLQNRADKGRRRVDASTAL